HIVMILSSLRPRHYLLSFLQCHRPPRALHSFPTRRSSDLHWWPSDSAIASTDYEGRAGCINLGHCTGGCAQGAKASSDITYWPRSEEHTSELQSPCNLVCRLLLEKKKKKE